MYRQQCKIVCLFFAFASLLQVNCQDSADDVDEFTIKRHSRSDRSAGRSRVVTGTFRFRRVMSGDEARKAPKAAGWDIEGCYCETGTRCSCSGNRNRVRMFVRTGSKRPPMPGSMGIPLPPAGMFGGEGGGGGGGGGDDGGELDGGGGGASSSSPGIGMGFPSSASPAGVETMEPESERLVRNPPAANRRGCFCNANGCSGSDCSTMNGCVCSQGACWGSACDSRIPLNAQAPMMTSGNLLATNPAALTNPLQLVRNALFASSPVVSVNGQPANQQQQQQTSGQLQQQQNGAAVTIGDCSCSAQGCTGTACAAMNGCFCVGSNCWGNSCNINSIMQASGNLLANSNPAPSNQVNQAVNQVAALSNLAGRLTLPQLNLASGALALGGQQGGQQAGNLIDIPGLTGPGGILNSLLPGGFGGGGGGGDTSLLNPFGGGGGGGGGYGQGMQVVKGVPVKRLTAARARRIRGKATRGRPGMELAATRGRVRPSHTVRKRIRPIEASDESSQTLTAVMPQQRVDPVIGVIRVNDEFNDEYDVNNSTVMRVPDDFLRDENEVIQKNSNMSNSAQESVDVFTFTDEWLNEMAGEAE